MDFEQISTQKTPGPETKTTTTKIKKKYTREKTLFLKHHLEIYLWRRVAFSWIPVWLYWAAAQLPRLLRWPHWLIIYSLFVEFWQSVKWELGKCSNNSNADLNVLQDKMPEVKEKPREKGNYNSAAWPETHTFNEGGEKSWAAQGRKQQTSRHRLKNVITHPKSTKSEMKPTGAPFSSCGWFLCTRDGKEEAPETGSETTRQ